MDEERSWQPTYQLGDILEEDDSLNEERAKNAVTKIKENTNTLGTITNKTIENLDQSEIDILTFFIETERNLYYASTDKDYPKANKIAGKKHQELKKLFEEEIFTKLKTLGESIIEQQYGEAMRAEEVDNSVEETAAAIEASSQ